MFRISLAARHLPSRVSPSPGLLGERDRDVRAYLHVNIEHLTSCNIRLVLCTVFGEPYSYDGTSTEISDVPGTGQGRRTDPSKY